MSDTEHLYTDEHMLMTLIEVAEFLPTPPATLRYWRHLGIGPKSFKPGRTVRYWRDDVLTWLSQQS